MITRPSERITPRSRRRNRSLTPTKGSYCYSTSKVKFNAFERAKTPHRAQDSQISFMKSELYSAKIIDSSNQEKMLAQTRTNYLSLIFFKFAKKRYFNHWRETTFVMNKILVTKILKGLTMKAKLMSALSIVRFRMNQIRRRSRYYLRLWRVSANRIKRIKQIESMSSKLSHINSKITLINIPKPSLSKSLSACVSHPMEGGSLPSSLLKSLTSNTVSAFSTCQRLSYRRSIAYSSFLFSLLTSLLSPPLLD